MTFPYGDEKNKEKVFMKTTNAKPGVKAPAKSTGQGTKTSVKPAPGKSKSAAAAPVQDCGTGAKAAAKTGMRTSTSGKTAQSNSPAKNCR
jgi:hypothetical protein